MESVDTPDLKSVDRKGRGGSSPPTPIAPVAQLVERGFCKADVASSSLVGGFGELAQLVERLLCTQEVRGSSPLFSTPGGVQKISK